MHYFIDPDFSKSHPVLNEEESVHAIRVLRLNAGNEIMIGDGEGNLYKTRIETIGKKKLDLTILETEEFSRPNNRLILAISPTKNTNRFEWLVEKCTELGVDEMIPLQTDRTERPRIRIDRLEKIVISATKQSQRVFKPVLHELTGFETVVKKSSETKLIAHCISSLERNSLENIQTNGVTLVLVGPEGDFTEKEVELAKNAGFSGIDLGENRLRTETAGMYITAVLKMRKDPTERY